jgi:hypothetical protein
VRVVINTSVVVTPCHRLQVGQMLLDGGGAEFLVETPHNEFTEGVESKLVVRLFRLVSAGKRNTGGADVLIFDLEAAIVGLCAITGDEG